MPRYTIDRFEDRDWTVLEDEQAQMIRVPVSWVPKGAHEGDVLTGSVTEYEGNDPVPRLEIDAVTTEERRARAKELRDGLQRGPKGDISL